MYQHKSDFANDLIKFFHVIGIKKINYNVYNNKLGNSGKECKTERESEKDYFFGKTKILKTVGNALDAVSNVVADSAQTIATTLGRNKSDKGLAETEITRAIKGMIENANETITRIRGKINSSLKVTIDSSRTSSQNDDIQDINDLKNRAETILKNITEQIDTIPEDKQEEVSNNIKKLTENANKIIDDIKEKLEISENINVLNKTAQDSLNRIKASVDAQQQSGGGNDGDTKCIKYDHTTIRTALFASKWMNRGYSLDFMDQKQIILQHTIKMKLTHMLLMKMRLVSPNFIMNSQILNLLKLLL